MTNFPKQAIALIYFPHPFSERSGHNSPFLPEILSNLAPALAKVGWQVDRFIGKLGDYRSTHLSLVPHSPDYRTVYIHTSNLSEFVQALTNFATQQASNYPLIHTWNWLAAKVGLQLKNSTNVQWLHSDENDNNLVALDDCHYYQHSNWQICHHADEIIQFSFSQFQPRVQSKTQAKRQLGFSAWDKIVLCVDVWDRIEQVLQITTQLEQIPLIRSDLRFSCQALHWIFLNSHPLHPAQKQIVQKYITALNLQQKVHCLESERTEEFLLYHCAADVCVIPDRYEPFADKALLAIACGTPVVASGYSGARFAIVPQETGLLVTADEPMVWGEAIARVLLSDKQWVRHLWQYYLGCYEPQLSWTVTAAHLSEVYRRLLAQTIAQTPFWKSQKPYTILLPEQLKSCTHQSLTAQQVVSVPAGMETRQTVSGNF